MGRKAVFRAFSRGGGHGIMKKTIPGGACHAEGQMESEHRLHIGAAAGEPAADLPLRPDDRGGPDGLREDHGGELVSRAACEGGDAARHPRQRVLRQPRHPLAERAGRLRPRGACVSAGLSLPDGRDGRRTARGRPLPRAGGGRALFPVYRRLPPADRRAGGGVSLHARKPPAGERTPDRRQP